jgi:hypothetical protein
MTTPRRFDYAASIIVQRPIGAVAAFLIEPSNAEHWVPRATTVVWREPGAMKVGSALERTWYDGHSGRTYRRTWVVMELVPTERFVMRSRFADDQSFEWLPVFEEFEYQWSAADGDETVLSLRCRSRADGRAGVVTERIFGRLNLFEVRRKLRRLKSLLEAANAP